MSLDNLECCKKKVTAIVKPVKAFILKYLRIIHICMTLELCFLACAIYAER